MSSVMAASPSEQSYTKHFVPLESDPELFTELIQSLGASKSLSFQDVYSVDDPDLLLLVPKPVYALILILPTTPDYVKRVALEEASASVYSANDKVTWFSQTINNACGLYAILHAVANSPAKDFIEPMSTLSQILSAIHGKSVEEVAKVLEGSQKLETASHAVATQDSTSPPPNAEDEVDYHYICFVKSEDGSCLYELDGERNGPIKRVSLPPNSDMLCEAVLQVVRSYLQAEKEGSLEFNLMALCNKQNKEEIGISDVGTQGVSLSEKDS